MRLRFPTKEVAEGKARILVPKLNVESGEPIQHLRSEAPVFYNPVMKTNRDTAVLFLSAIQSKQERELELCEPMCGSGVRGVRFLVELDSISNVVMGDLNPTAINLASQNARLNNVEERASLRLLDANLLLSLHSYPGGRFDYVDIDPYGSPSPFLNNGVLSIRNHGYIALTATDMAPLCGVNKRACIRKYGGRSIQSEFCHEVAIRLLTGALIRTAAIHETSAHPLFSFYSDHYIRLYARLDKGAKITDQKISEMGYIKYCKRCLYRESSYDNKREKCPNCDEHYDIAGPLWLGELAEKGFMELMLQAISNKKYLENTNSENLLRMVSREIGYPVGFYDIDKICSLIGSKSISTSEAIGRINDEGYRVTLTHFDNRSIKTDANIFELREVLAP